MARPMLKPFSFTENGIKFIIELPENYESIARALGLTILANNYEPAESDVGVTVSECLKVGRGLRIRISYRGRIDPENEASRVVTKSSRIFCPTSKVDTALKTLKSLSYNNFPITGSGIPRRRRLG